MDKKITIFAKIGLVLVALGWLFTIFHWPGAFIMFMISLFGILPLFFVFNLIRELKEGEESKISVFTYFLGSLSFLFGMGFNFLKYDFEVNFFLISIGLFSLFLLINGLERIKENKINVIPYIVYPIVLFLVIISFKFYLISELDIHSWLQLSLPYIFMLALITYVILLVNSIKKTEFKLSNYNQLKLVVLLTTLSSYNLVLLKNSIPIRTQDVTNINLALLQEENENQVVLGNSLITEKNKERVSKMDLETQKIIKKLDSLKFVFLSNNDTELFKQLMNNKFKTTNTNEQLTPKYLDSYIINPSHILELTNYDYPYQQIDIYRKKILKIVFPKLTKIRDFDEFRNSEDLKLKITKYADEYKLTTDEKILLLMILMIDSKNTERRIHDSNVDFRKYQFQNLTLISAINILTNLQNEILSTRTLIISHI